jgi:hypothetical protein
MLASLYLHYSHANIYMRVDIENQFFNFFQARFFLEIDLGHDDSRIFFLWNSSNYVKSFI